MCLAKPNASKSMICAAMNIPTAFMAPTHFLGKAFFSANNKYQYAGKCNMDRYMKICLKEAEKGMKGNEGGPFGAVIVKDGKVIAKAHNTVISTNDPTSHAEMNAIREASRKLKRFDLSDCELYTACEPCPMCFSAIHWAKIRKVYYGCSREDASKIGFDDKFIYDVLNGRSKKKKVTEKQINRKDMLKPFNEWMQKQDKVQY